MIKNVAIFLFVLLTTVGLSQEVNQTDAQGKKQGVWKKYHSNGLMRYTGTFKDDKPVGLFKYYYDSGKLQAKISHFGNESYANIYYPIGAVKSTGKYINQKKDSLWTYYDVKGHKTATEYYTEGVKNGVCKIYYTDGTVAEEKEYLNDFEKGSWKQYFSNGKLKRMCFYIKGSLEGKAYFYTSDGKKRIVGHYFHGTRNGDWIYFKPDGSAERKETYYRGQRVDKNKDDRVIYDDSLKYEKKDYLDFEDMHPPRR